MRIRQSIFKIVPLFIMMMGLLLVPGITAEASTSGKCGDYVTWELQDGGSLVISGSGDMWNLSSAPKWDKASVKTVIIQDGITSIGDANSSKNGYFSNCENLEHLYLGKDIKSIGNNAFYGCKALDEEVVIPQECTVIGVNAFSGCEKIISVRMEDKVEEIKSQAFEDCISLANVTLSNKLKVLGYSCFEHTAIQQISIPETVTDFGYSTFSRCFSLSKVDIPYNTKITKLSGYNFQHCSKLTSITIPETVQEIGYAVFAGTGITKVTLPPYTKSVGKYAFATAYDMIEITASDNVVYEEDAFKYDGTIWMGGTEEEPFAYKTTPSFKTYYSIFFESNGGFGYMSPVSVTEKTYTLPECEFTANEGIVFDKWDAGEVGDVITFDSSMTIKAKWKLEHNVEPVEEIPATCEKTGTKAYYICTDEGCGKKFLDDKYKEEITDESELVIPAKGHKWGEWEETTPATINTKGVETRTCKNDATHTETRVTPTLSHTHDMVKIPAKEAGCEEPGNVEYWHCANEECNRCFSDLEGKTEIELVDTVTSPTGHSVTLIKEKEATCETDGNIDHYKCDKCGKLFEDDKCTKELSVAEVTIAAKGHDWTAWTIIREATETTAGIKIRTCRNDATHTESEDIPALGGHAHPLKQVAAKEINCENDGNIEYWYCETCDKYFADKDATEELTRSAVFVKTTGHDWGEWTTLSEASETSDGIKVRICKRDSSHIEKEIIPKISSGSSTTPTQKDTSNTSGTTSNTSGNTTEEKKSEKSATPAKEGTDLSDVTTGVIYTAVASSSNEPSVSFKAADTKSASVTIPATVTIDGVNYKVVSVSENAFKNNKTITTVTIDENVETIEANAFSGCTKLKTVKVGTNVTSIKAGAFAGNTSLTKITIPASVKSIGKNAFKGCKSLKNITIKTTKLTKKTVGTNAFKGIHKKAVIKVPKKKLKDYKKILKKVGINGKKQKIK